MFFLAKATEKRKTQCSSRMDDTYACNLDSTTKKRNHSEVSASSLSPSPSAKMSNTESSPTETGETRSHLSKLDSLRDLGTDNESLHTKVDTVIELLHKMIVKLDNDKDHTTEEVSNLKEENKYLNSKVQEAEGRMDRMSREITKLNTKIEDLQVRTMSSNILIRNLPEQQPENIYEVVHDVLANKLKIPNSLLHSPSNPAAPVQVDIAHRMGMAKKKIRPIVVKLVLRRGKDIILSHAKNLKGTKISICEHLPSEMRERRDAQFSTFKSFKEEHRNNTNVKVRLTRDKLFVNNSLIPDGFEEKPLSIIHSQLPSHFKYTEMNHTDVIEYSQSYFQGHSQKINSISEAYAAHSALFQDSHVASAHHISYAYTITTDKGITSGHSDDGEIGAGKILKMILEQNSIENVLIAVSRHHNGPNLGQKRFDLIRSTALKALD